MLKLALIGRSIQHSKSELMYRDLLSTPFKYDLLDYEDSQRIPEATKLLEDYCGVSITAPYKKHFLDQVTLSIESEKYKAINCLYKHESKIYGALTDFFAVQEIINNFKKYYTNPLFIILGGGNMAMMTEDILRSYQLEVQRLSRKTHGDISKQDLVLDEKRQVIVINCCSREFVFRGEIASDTVFWDMNYNFSEHQHLQKKCRYQDGLEMLKLQAAHACKLWRVT